MTIVPSKTMIFDFDGTLADSFQSTIDTFMKLSKRYDPKAYAAHKDDDFLMYKNFSSKEVLKHFKISKIKLILIVWLWRREVKKTLFTLKMFPSLGEVLIKLHSNGWKLGIITSNSTNNMKAYLKGSGIDVFDFVYGDVSLFGKTKSFRKVIKKEYLDVNYTYYVGDQPRDIEAAKSVGFRSVAVDWGFCTNELLKKYSPDYLLHRPIDLLRVGVKQSI